MNKTSEDEELTEMIDTYLHGIHHPDEDPLKNDLRAMKNTIELKRVIKQRDLARDKVIRLEELTFANSIVTMHEFTDRIKELEADSPTKEDE